MRCTRAELWIVFWLAAAALSCTRVARAFRCDHTSQCVLDGLPGQCEPDGLCSLLDATCPSGRRYIGDGAPARRCVDEATPPDLASAADLSPLAPPDLTSASTLFTDQFPGALDYRDPQWHELGLKLQSGRPGQILGIRYYKAPSETGTHIGHLWSANGDPLATVTFASESAVGWHQALLPTPVDIAANTTYIVSVNSNGYYSSTNMGLQRAVINPPLSTVEDDKNGVFGAPGVFPTDSYLNTNYFRDIVFSAR